MTTATPLLVADFTRTIDALDQGVLVRSIMSQPLVTIAPDDDPAAFFERRKADGFDCAPVQRDGRIVGMVYWADVQKGGGRRAEEVMRSLDQVPIVAGTETVSGLIRAMKANGEHFWLVLNGTEINAIVTRSDLWRLPVRLLAMSRLVHLEKLMQELIRARGDDAGWMAVMPDDRKAKIEAEIKKAAARNEQLDPLESTSFSDKLTIFEKHLERKREAKDLGGINALRNKLMHGREDGDDEASIESFLGRLERMDTFIKKWTRELSEGVSRDAGDQRVS